MRVGVSLRTRPLDGEEPGAVSARIADVASLAERLGYDAVHALDHPVPHPAYDIPALKHSYHNLDPFVELAVAAGVTSRVRLWTNLVLLAYRNPFVTAKLVASLDVVSSGRLIFGVGTGYQVEEFAALGVPFDQRNEIMDEAFPAMKAAWTGEPFDFVGKGFAAAGNQALPRPVQQPHPPIWVGGNSPRAVRRAVEFGQGWTPIPEPPYTQGARGFAPLSSFENFADRIAYARAHAERIGRTEPLDIAFSTTGFAYWKGEKASKWQQIDNAGRLAEMGVTYLTPGALVGPDASHAEYLEALERHAEEFLPHLSAL
ncbi:TIGR03619 family F420-dependent LLM class oxidoreductase [Frankia gtarii]|uniref:TIGR03619 family F420-dependent LLM class oxidoreductase n=1 Tax=Frankia gtarii TaxID=2950102 RepID=UPI0021C0FC0C|nr:TIGR03619 family F420-dependent LLM class oxidoreductase [Frankia gtarii]